MPDTLTPAQRSECMRAVRYKNTSTEMRVRKLVHGMGYRYRLHSNSLPGKPDIVFAGKRKVIFVHGCFWHSHNCPRGARSPKTNVDYWARKRARNAERDLQWIREFEERGWEVLVVWECWTKDPTALESTLRAFLGEVGERS